MGGGKTVTSVRPTELSEEEKGLIDRQEALLDLQIEEFGRMAGALAEMWPETKELLIATQQATMGKIQSEREGLAMLSRVRGTQEEAYRSAAEMLGIQSAQTLTVPTFEEWAAQSGLAPAARMTAGTPATAGTPGTAATPGTPGKSAAEQAADALGLEGAARAAALAGRDPFTETGLYGDSPGGWAYVLSQYKDLPGTPGTPAAPATPGTPATPGQMSTADIDRLRPAYEAYVASRKRTAAAPQSTGDRGGGPGGGGGRGEGTFGSPYVPAIGKLPPPGAPPLVRPGAPMPYYGSAPGAPSSAIAALLGLEPREGMPENDPLGLRRLVTR